MFRTTPLLGVAILVILVGLAGCARSAPPGAVAKEHATNDQVAAPASPSPAQALLATMREKREAVQSELDALLGAAAVFRAKNPSAFIAPELIPQRLQQVSQEYVNAQLATINARARYAAGHPVLKSTERREQELAEFYERELARAMEHEAKMAEHFRLQAAIAEKQELLRGIQDQIRSMELAAKTER